ncbi:Intermembrane transport protein PqiA [Cupriavidus campinensis]|uniref:paraquat-inducible protein A n=1 Tax=Cupriavidus campinensis TaxID=151783 RepID=UPI001B241D3A|nr:paraquat-inducible protein A [Cupriavidus campinensis]CAG2151582.1 Intermembrane transport protein PqiA [Cupriavidus campinensis]
MTPAPHAPSETPRDLPADLHPDLHRLVACEYCDALYERTALAPGERAACLRCGGPLYRESSRAYRRLLPLVVTALILFLISNAFPIVEMDLKGVRTQTTLIGAVQALFADQMAPVALLVFATTILFPLSEMLMMGYLLVPMARRQMPPGFDRIVRGIRQTRPWGMIEVFMIGVLVTLVKLSTMAQVLPGVALWSFGALVVVLAAMLSFDPRDLWHYLEPPGADEVPPRDEAHRP